MARQRRSFSEEFKREAVKLADQTGSSKADIARDLGISASLLARWHRVEEAGKSPAAKASMPCRQRSMSACAASSQRLKRSAIY
jgi:transposase